jgi:hypothetical protein
MILNKKKFDFHDLPIAYLNDNNKANKLRHEIIKNQVRINECEQGDLENTFFSDENIALINKQLILTVFKKTNGQYKITDQSTESLTIVMRYVFLEHARHLPYNILEQIRELNFRVVNEILPIVITQITQRTEYLKTISEPRNMLSLPINVHGGSRQNLPSVTTTFNHNS